MRSSAAAEKERERDVRTHAGGGGGGRPNSSPAAVAATGATVYAASATRDSYARGSSAERRERERRVEDSACGKR